MITSGRMLMSTLPAMSETGRRRPSSSTRLRLVPRPWRLIEARPPVPCPPVAALPPTVKLGTWLSASCSVAVPDSWIFSCPMVMMGLTEVLFGRWISEPVTTMSEPSSSASSDGSAAWPSSWAKAGRLVAANASAASELPRRILLVALLVIPCLPTNERFRSLIDQKNSVELDALHVADDKDVRSGPDQREHADEGERAIEGARLADDDPDHDRGNDPGQVGAEVEHAAGQSDQLTRRDVGDQRPAEVDHALAEEGDRHDGDDDEVILDI